MFAACAALTGITLIGPFTGDRSESFENAYPTFGTSCVTNGAFGGLADICTPTHAGCVVTTQWTGTNCTQQPHSGSWLYGNAAQLDPDNFALIEFVQPVIRFGGYFSRNTPDSGGEISFYSADGTLLGTRALDLPGGCNWTWNGFDAGTEPAFKTILVRGASNAAVLLDDLQVDFARPSPGTDTCFPGTGGVLPCPCANSGALGRGCNNSAGTGGARLNVSGVASLQNDTLLLTTNGQCPHGMSIVLQGNGLIAHGAAFGQGVTCVGGNMRRLFVKSSTGGAIAVPGAGDPSISARSAALGDAFGPGARRWYAVYYRDTNVPGGCPAASTYNISQTQLVHWTQ